MLGVVAVIIGCNKSVVAHEESTEETQIESISWFNKQSVVVVKASVKETTKNNKRRQKLHSSSDSSVYCGWWNKATTKAK